MSPQGPDSITDSDTREVFMIHLSGNLSVLLSADKALHPTFSLLSTLSQGRGLRPFPMFWPEHEMGTTSTGTIGTRCSQTHP